VLQNVAVTETVVRNHDKMVGILEGLLIPWLLLFSQRLVLEVPSPITLFLFWGFGPIMLVGVHRDKTVTFTMINDS